MRKKFFSLFISAILLMAALTCTAAESRFEDLPSSHWAYDAVMDLVGKGIIDGKSGTHFDPNGRLKREEFAKIAVLAITDELSDASGSFTDVEAGSWYEPYVETALSTGILKGVSDTEFGVGGTLTKQDAVVVINRIVERKGVSTQTDSAVIFADDSDISDYAREAIMKMTAAGVVGGDSNNCFLPLEQISRVSLCVMLHRALHLGDKIIQTGTDNPNGWNFYPPYEHILGDKLAEAMPPPFDPETMDRYDIALIDLESSDFSPFTNSSIPKEGVEITSDEAYSGNNSIKITKAAGAAQLGTTFLWDEEVHPGDWYAFSAMVKATEMTAGAPRIVIQAYSAAGKWIREKSAGAQILSNTDWYNITALIEIPEEAARIRIMCFLQQASGGTAYYDDLKVSKIIFDPMDTVLLTPSYKGLIYGDGGVGDINMEALFYDYNGAYDLSKMSFKAQVVNAKDEVLMQAEIPHITQKISVSFSSDNLETGDYYIQGILTDRETGEIVSKKEWTLRKRDKDYRPAVYLDEYNRLVKDGELHFPMMMYNSNSYDDFVDDVIGTPIKTMSHYGVGWWLSEYKYKDMLQKMRENNLQIKLTLLTFLYSNLSTKEARELVTEQLDIRPLVEGIIEKYKDDPILYGYYLFDEADPVRYGEEIRWLNEICANTDIDRPTMGVTAAMARYGIFTKMVDVVGTDPYPVMGREDDDVAKVSRYIRQLRADFPNRPVYIVMQGFHWKDPRYLRAPTEEEMRNMMWQAFCEGAQGLEWYSYRAMKNDDEKPFSQWWQEAKNLYREAEMFSPILLSVEPAPYYEVKGGGDWLNITSRRYEGKSYVFTANNVRDYNSAIIRVEGAKSVKELYSGQIYKVDDNGWFEVEFNPLGVNVFEIEQDDYLSPESKLLSFGICGDKDSYIVYDNGDEMQLNIPSEISSVSYGAKISDNAKLYINGSECELTGEISIDGIDEITVRVVSEDSRFYTERVYKINRH